MPTQECWEELGALRADITMQIELLRRETEHTKALEERIHALELDKIRLKTIGGIIAFLLTGLGVFFAEPIKKFFTSLLLG